MACVHPAAGCGFVFAGKVVEGNALRAEAGRVTRQRQTAPGTRGGVGRAQAPAPMEDSPWEGPAGADVVTSTSPHCEAQPVVDYGASVAAAGADVYSNAAAYHDVAALGYAYPVDPAAAYYTSSGSWAPGTRQIHHLDH